MKTIHKFQIAYNILLGIGLASLFFFFIIKKEKIAYVDFDLLLRKYEGTKPMGEKFEKGIKVFRDNINTLTNELNRDVKAFELDQRKLSSQERNFKKEELQKRQNDLLRYQEAIGAKIENEQEKFIDDLSDTIRNYLAEYSAKNNYRIIFFKNKQTIAFGEEGSDITEEILDGLNEKYRSKE